MIFLEGLLLALQPPASKMIFLDIALVPWYTLRAPLQPVQESHGQYRHVHGVSSIFWNFPPEWTRVKSASFPRSCMEKFYGLIVILPWQCWKSKIQALPQVIGFSPKRANSLGQSAPNLCSDSQVFHGTIRLARAITWHSLWAWLWLSLCLCPPYNAKISLFCASKSSLTASYFRLIVSNLLSLYVQLSQTKAAFPAPKYCDTSPSERIVCCWIGGCKQNQLRKGRFWKSASDWLE